MSTARRNHAGSGTANNALATSGENPSLTAATEEWAVANVTTDLGVS
jgi:hypothetical protein